MYQSIRRPATIRARSAFLKTGRLLGTVPMQVHVQPFTLPDTIAMRSNFGSLGSRLAKQLKMDAGSKEFAAAEDRYIDMLLAHRAIPSSLGNIWPAWTPDGGIDDSDSGERLRRMVQQRHVNALMVPFLYRHEPEKCRAYLRDMADYLRGKGWLDLAYIYLEDEPNNAEQYETVRAAGRADSPCPASRECVPSRLSPPTRIGAIFTVPWISGARCGASMTKKPLDSGKSWVRRFGPTRRYVRAKARRRSGRLTFRRYTSAPPFWISWHFDVKGFLYWSSIYSAPGQDPWVAPHFRDQYWGEGMLLYPGRPGGVNGPVASIRLKLIREALEDFEYMALASRQGREAEVDAIVDSLATSFNDWSHDPAAYEAARLKLAALIGRQ